MITENIEYQETLQKVSNAIKKDEYILVGGASGMSSANGPDWYNDDDPKFMQNFKDIIEKYHSRSLWKTYYLEQYSHQSWKSREDWWGFLITLMHFIMHEPVYQAYADLKKYSKTKIMILLQQTKMNNLLKHFQKKMLLLYKVIGHIYNVAYSNVREMWK